MSSAMNSFTMDAVGNVRSAAAFPAAKVASRALRASAARIDSPSTGTCRWARNTASVPIGG
jgi:hypothetical protein